MSRPSARPFASSQTPQNGWTASGFRPITAANHSGSPHSLNVPVRRRVSLRQLDAIAAELTDYHRAVVLVLAELRLATGHQLARRLWSSKNPGDPQARAARRCLGRLEGWRVVDRLPQRVGGVRGGSTSIVYGLGPTGRRLLDRMGYQPRRLGAPGVRYVAHTLAITELVVRLHTADLGGELDLVELQTEPRCWRGFLGAMAVRQVLKPDLFVRIGAGAFEDRYFLEVDLATEAKLTILDKAGRYIAYYRAGEEQRRHDVFPWVVWAVPDKRRAEQIGAALERLPDAARQLFRIWQFDEVVGRLAAEAGI